MARVPNGARYRALVTGRAPLDLDVRTAVTRDSAEGEKRLLPLTLIILVLAFGALVAAMLPLLVGVLAIAVSLAIIGILAHYTPMSVFVLNMTTMIGLGVGIDYSLLVVTRFREELARGARRQIAAVNTLSTAGRAVITSGLTVVVGFARRHSAVELSRNRPGPEAAATPRPRSASCSQGSTRPASAMTTSTRATSCSGSSTASRDCFSSTSTRCG